MSSVKSGIFTEWLNIILSTLSRSEKMFIIGFFIILIYYLINGNTKERIFFFIQPSICFLFVLNPVATQFFYSIIGSPFSDRLYRFFWAFPIYFAYAYFFAAIIINVTITKWFKSFYL